MSTVVVVKISDRWDFGIKDDGRQTTRRWREKALGGKRGKSSDEAEMHVTVYTRAWKGIAP